MFIMTELDWITTNLNLSPGSPYHFGSPVSPCTGASSQGGGAGYLPGYLMGDSHQMSPASPLINRWVKRCMLIFMLYGKYTFHVK